MPDASHDTEIDLQEVTTRNRTARAALRDLWRLLNTALADASALVAEIRRLRAELVRSRRDHADLLAAARATLTADHDAETDPLFYLRDELGARGTLPPGIRGSS